MQDSSHPNWFMIGLFMTLGINLRHVNRVPQSSGRWRGFCILQGAVNHHAINYFNMPLLWTLCMWLIIQTLAWTSNTQRESVFMTRLLIYNSCLWSPHVTPPPHHHHSLLGVTQISEQVVDHEHKSGLNVEAADSAGELLFKLSAEGRDQVWLTTLIRAATWGGCKCKHINSQTHTDRQTYKCHKKSTALWRIRSHTHTGDSVILWKKCYLQSWRITRRRVRVKCCYGIP